MTQPQNTITLTPAKVFIALFLWLGLSAFLVDSFIHLYKTGVEADLYKKAAFCNFGNECRREIEAEILDSHTLSIDKPCCRKYDFDSYPKILSYYIEIKFAYGETYTIRLEPNLNMNVKDFMLNNVYLPAPQSGYEKMAEASFIKGHKVKIEMYKNKPSMIYSMVVLGAPRLSGKNEYAIPTDDNPLVYDVLERRNFVKTSGYLAIGFLFVLTLFFLY